MAKFSVNESGEDNFYLTATDRRHLDPSNTITLTKTTKVTTFTAAQYSGVEIYAFNASNAQLFLDGYSASGYLLTPNGYTGLGFTNLPAGRWYIGVQSLSLTGTQTVRGFDELSVVTFGGKQPNNNIPMKVNGDEGAWAQQGFTVKGHPKMFIETEASGGKYVVMTDSQFSSFYAANPNGYNGGGYEYITWSKGHGVAATEIETKLALPAGHWNLVWINDSGSWAGGAANITVFRNNKAAGVSVDHDKSSSEHHQRAPDPDGDTVDRIAGDDRPSGQGNVFVFDGPLTPSTPVDRIADFSPFKDTIALEHDVFRSIGKGELQAKFFNDGGRPADRNDHVLYDPSSGTVSYDPDGAGGHAQIAFARVGAHQSLTHLDFLVV